MSQIRCRDIIGVYKSQALLRHYKSKASPPLSGYTVHLEVAAQVAVDCKSRGNPLLHVPEIFLDLQTRGRDLLLEEPPPHARRGCILSPGIQALSCYTPILCYVLFVYLCDLLVFSLRFCCSVAKAIVLLPADGNLKHSS
jgi:hypothetical protein